jgi:CheY-like chemotaxis protein
VLVVEDHPDLNKLISDARSPRSKTGAAFDGQEGLRIALELRPDLIICDVMMPGLSGTELVRSVPAAPDIAATPILVVSARLMQAKLREAQVLADRDRIARDLHQRVITELLRLSMLLGAVRSISASPAGERIDEAMTRMDEIVREIRAAIFDTDPRPARRQLRPEYQLILDEYPPDQE